MKTMFGILSWNNDFSKTINSLNTDFKNIIVCTNICVEINKNYHCIEAVPSVAASKNRIIAKARELKADKLFILEDDIEVLDMLIFDKYVAIMDILNQGVLFYGYNSNTGMNNNKVYGLPNPGIIIKINDSFGELYFNRFITTSCIGFDLAKNPLLFDEELQLLEVTEYLQRCSDNGIVKTGNGFHVDYPESWKYFKRVEVSNHRVKTQQMLDADRQILQKKNIQIKIDMIVDKLADYLKTLTFPDKI